MKYDLATLTQEWQRADARTRWFLVTHALANAGIVLGSIASTVCGLMGQGRAQLVLLAVASLCGVQAVLSWSALQRQFKDRYSLL